MPEPKHTYAYVDAANLFYGGKKSLGWSIDYEKLVTYLKNKYQVSQIHYFGGVEIYDFPFDYLKLEKFGYKLILKPVKTYEDEDGNPKRKANCDVDLAFSLMRDKDNFDRAIIL